MMFVLLIHAELGEAGAWLMLTKKITQIFILSNTATRWMEGKSRPMKGQKADNCSLTPYLLIIALRGRTRRQFCCVKTRLFIKNSSKNWQKGSQPWTFTSHDKVCHLPANFYNICPDVEVKLSNCCWSEQIRATSPSLSPDSVRGYSVIQDSCGHFSCSLALSPAGCH